MQNNTIGNKLEAWLMFFSSDRPEELYELDRDTMKLMVDEMQEIL